MVQERQSHARGDDTGRLDEGRAGPRAPRHRSTPQRGEVGALSPLSLPPRSLDGFPAKQFRKGSLLYRIHARGESPWWFSSGGSGRFDLADDEHRGTCYLAEHPLGSFVEVFRDPSEVSAAVLDARVLTRLPVRAFRLADATDGRARRFGVTAALHSSEDYERTQAWAAAFAEAGFDGIRYLVSHDPRARLVGVALFGPKGSPRWAKGRADPIPAAVIKEAEQRFGIRVLPPPRGRD